MRPDVVYCQAQGFASTSDQAGAPAYDDIIQAASGIPDTFRLAGSKPTFVPTILADKVCAMAIVYAVLAAVLHRARTGEGQRVEVPMVDVVRAFMLTEHGAGAIPVPATGPSGYQRILVANRRPQVTRDGYVHILPYETKHYDAIFETGGRVDLLGDGRYADGGARISNAEFLYGVLHELTPQRSTDEWIEFCQRNGIPATRVASLDELIDDLPIRDHPIAGQYRHIPSPVHFSATPGGVRRVAPLIGQHSREVLTELGFDEESIDDLASRGVVRCATLPTGSAG
jgi:crotonobetainyl-CoA:carnitine CoA-transferase CaiB-like acyl-CoA transferase